MFEILSFHGELLQRLSEAGVRVDDYRFIALYRDYIGMKSGGDKVTYIVAVLASRYHVSERKVYDVIRLMTGEIHACMKEDGREPFAPGHPLR